MHVSLLTCTIACVSVNLVYDKKWNIIVDQNKENFGGIYRIDTQANMFIYFFFIIHSGHNL